MRISTPQIYRIAIGNMQDTAQALARTQEQLSTGRRLLSPADDPVASTQILQINQELALQAQYQKNIDLAENDLRLEEVALQSVINIMQRMKEITIQAGNTGTLSPADYRTLAAEVDTRVDELQNILNSRSATGEYIFAGFQGGSRPFEADGGGGFAYRGDEGHIEMQVSNGSTIATSDSGKKLFVDIKTQENTIITSASSSNTSVPPVAITVGEVTDQVAYDAFYPGDMVISFNADNEVVPPSRNYNIIERNSGKLLAVNQLFSPGDDINSKGVRFQIIGGNPTPGTASTTATLVFESDSGGPILPAVFAFADETGETLSLRVGGITETLTIGSDVTNEATLITELTTGANATLLANLGVSINSLVSPPRFESVRGLNITLDPDGNSGANILLELGINSGSASINGVLALPRDQLFIKSSKTQNLLSGVSRFSLALKEVDGTPAGYDRVADVVANSLSNIDSVMDNMLEAESAIGARLNTLDSVRNLHLDSGLRNKALRASLQDLDYAEAATQLAAETFALQAAQQSFVRVSGLSLFSIL